MTKFIMVEPPVKDLNTIEATYYFQYKCAFKFAEQRLNVHKFFSQKSFLKYFLTTIQMYSRTYDIYDWFLDNLDFEFIGDSDVDYGFKNTYLTEQKIILDYLKTLKINEPHYAWDFIE